MVIPSELGKARGSEDRVSSDRNHLANRLASARSDGEKEKKEATVGRISTIRCCTTHGHTNCMRGGEGK